MAKFRKIDPRIWHDEKFRDLDAESKLIALYCLSSPQNNRVGLFRFSLGMAAEDLGLSSAKIDRTLDTLCHTLSWQRDKANNILYLPHWWRYNSPSNWKALKGYLEDLQQLPVTPLLAAFYDNTSDLPDTLCHTLYLARDSAAGYPMAYQEKEKETEKETEQETESGVPPKAPPPDTEGVTTTHTPRMTPSDFQAKWNALPAPYAKCRDMANRKAALATRLKEKGWLEHLDEGLMKLADSDFCKGQTNRGNWVATVDWILKPGNLTKVVEGHYDNRTQSDGENHGPHAPLPLEAYADYKLRNA